MAESVVLACEVRGGIVDNIYRGSIAVSDTNGGIVASIGDPMKVAFLRSSGKPLQAIAFVERGGAERYGLTPPEIAILCASHSGGPAQVATVRSILAKAGIPEEAIKSGSGIKDNCSGKHAGMLALAKMTGHPLENYRAPDHPIQQIIRAVVSEMCGIALADLRVAVDGCGAPIFAMPVRNMALAYARLANPDALPPPRAQACRTITAAMQAHPEMVGGLDWRRLTNGKIMAKAGASGCHCVGILGRGTGLAMKVDDGASAPIYAACFEMFRRQGYITAEEHRAFLAEHPPTVRNRAGEIVGEIQLRF